MDYINWVELLGVKVLTREKVYKLIGKSDDYYVYIIWKTYTDELVPFYVGKGHWQRIIKHGIKSDHNSNKYKTNIMKKHERQGVECGYSIFDFYKDEDEALGVEMELITLIGRSDLKLGPLANKTDGGDGTKGHLAPKGGDSASARPVFAKGKRYGCLKDAGLAHNIESGSIVARIKNGWKGYYYEDEGQRPQLKKILGRYKKKVSINGIKYESASEASRQTGMDVRMIAKRIGYGWEGYYYLNKGQLPRKTIWSDRDDKVAVIIKGKHYSTVADAIEKTGESRSMISKRCLSSNYTEYSRVDGKVEFKSTLPKNPEGVLVGLKHYKSIGIAAIAEKITTGGVSYRCRSSNYPDWRFNNQTKQKDESFIAPFSSIPVRVMIDGDQYESQSEAARAYNVDINTLKLRCKSPSFRSWICDGIIKKTPKDGRPSLINIEIDGVKFRSISEASITLGISRAIIKRRLDSNEWCEYEKS